MDSTAVERAIDKKRWSQSEVGDYKIHEGEELGGARDFTSYDDLAKACLKDVSQMNQGGDSRRT
jgi:hypothetical protein